ncbi:MAG: cellulase family glycosylhydrolase [Solirubrobacteraceae bacterium]
MNHSRPRQRWFAVLIVLAGWWLLIGSASAAVPVDPWFAAGITRAPGGPYLYDALGRRLQLHGVDLAAKCGGGARPARVTGTPCIGPAAGSQPAFVLSPTATDPGRRFTAGDAQTLALLGFTVVRLGIVWEGLEPGPAGVGPNDPRYCARHPPGTRFPSLGAADPYQAGAVSQYLAQTDRIVELLQAAGIRVIIDMHQDAYGSAFSHRSGRSPWNGEGAAGWATCTGARRLGAATAYWGQAYVDQAVQTAIGHFWRNDVRGDLQGQFARVWEAVARHYRDDPEVIGYEVFNEPTNFASADFSRQLQCAYAGPARAPRSCAGSHVQALRRGLIGAIELADPTHLVLYEPTISATPRQTDTVGVFEPLRFPRLVLAFHIYGTPPAGVYGCPGSVCLRSERRAIEAVLRLRARTHTERQPGGPAMVMDEFGGGPSIPDIAHVVDLARRASLSWSEWSALQLHDPTGAPGEGLLDQRTRRPWPAKARALSFPYPMATAGTPGPQSFDRASGRFRYSYLVDPNVRAPTEIIVPPFVYPHGYSVGLQGATVTSPAEASLLTLVALPGRRLVTVTVTSNG